MKIEQLRVVEKELARSESYGVAEAKHELLKRTNYYGLFLKQAMLDKFVQEIASSFEKELARLSEIKEDYEQAVKRGSRMQDDYFDDLRKFVMSSGHEGYSTFSHNPYDSPGYRGYVLPSSSSVFGHFRKMSFDDLYSFVEQYLKEGIAWLKSFES